MEICNNCNKVILKDYKFCPRCGKSLFGEEAFGGESSKQMQAVCSKEMTSFFHVAQNLNKAIDLDSLLKKIGEAVEDILDAERSSIMLLDESGTKLYFKIATGEDILKKLTIPLGHGIAGWIAQNKRPDIVNDPYNDERFSPETDKKTGFTTKSIAGAPMMLGDELIGIVEVINKRSGVFEQQDIDTLIGFCGLAAVSIANTRIKTDQKNFFANMLDFLVMGSEALGSPEASHKGHAWEMAKLAPQIGKELGMDQKRLTVLNHAALIHDIGFLGLENTDLIGIELNMELTEEIKLKLHPLIGAEMLKGIKVMQELIPFIQYHHRYKDGTGFPENLDTGNINKEMEIISILESYFALDCSIEGLNKEHFSPEVFCALEKVVQGQR